MAQLDFYVHVIGGTALLLLGLLLLTVQRPYARHILQRLCAVVLSILLLDLTTHIVPNALANFVYRSPLSQDATHKKHFS